MSAQPAAADARVPGVLCILGAMLALSLQDMVIKWISGAYPLHEIVLGRAVVALALTFGFVHLEGGLAVLRTRRLPLHLARGVLIVVANMSFFAALASMQLAEAVAVFFVAPLFITALSVPLLGEHVGPRRWLAVVIGMGGVVLMLRPGGGVIELAALLPVVGALAYALMQMGTRRLGFTDKASAMSFYVQLSFIAASGAIGLAVGDGRFAGSGHPSVEFLLRAWVWPSPGDASLIVLTGVLNAAGGYLLAQAYRVAEPSFVAPFEYTALPLAVLWGLLVFGDLPDGIATAGIVLIAGSGLYVFYRETVRGRPIAAQRPMPRNR